MFKSMGQPKQLYSDEESSMRSEELARFINGIEPKSIQTSTHAPKVEWFIRTSKDNLYMRFDDLNQDNKWLEHIGNIINT